MQGRMAYGFKEYVIMVPFYSIKQTAACVGFSDEHFQL